jgi:DNA replication and repair protein RecF
LLRRIWIDRISARNLRNFTAVEVELGERLNVLSGENAQGKTNFLDAAYLLATSRSFRSYSHADLVQRGHDVGAVRGQIVDSGVKREQSVVVHPRSRVVHVDGKRPASLSDYVRQTPIVVFHPGDAALVSGGGMERRRLLDRICWHVRPSAGSDLRRYERAARERQQALAQRGPTTSDLDHWEVLMVQYGLALREARQDACTRLTLAMNGVFSSISPPDSTLTIRYVSGAPEDRTEYAAALARSRSADASRGSCHIGPQRDDLTFELNGVRARGLASQGQQRLLVLTLKCAEMEILTDVHGVRPILLLDDVSSELDRRRTASLFEFMRQQDGQILLTTTRPELIDPTIVTGANRRDFSVEAGGVRAI